MLTANDLKPRLVFFPGCDLVGIYTRTSKTLEAKSDGYIPTIWAKFYAGGLLDKIPNKIDETVVAVRFDYEGDPDETFKFFLGCRVTSPVDIPAGMFHLYIPNDDYAIFTTRRGESPHNVYETWSAIEKLKTSDIGGNRKYSFDFEVYDLRTMNYRDSMVDIYVAQAPELNS